MSCSSINNIARVVDVNQVLQLNGVEAANYVVPQRKSAGVNVAPGPAALPAKAVAKGVGDGSAAISSLVALMTSFFTQLLGLVSDKKDKAVPVAPVVPPQPDVSPRVLPEPPKPNPAVNIPGLSDKRSGAKPDNIWSGFRQGPDGNCVTVSAIKAAMYRFGQSPTDIYKDVRREGSGYRVVMRDDVIVTLSDRELAEGVRGAQFIGPDKGMLKDAQFLFAVSAKRAQMENNDRTAGRSYSAAVRSLNDGEDESGPGEGFKRLGLRQHMRKVSVAELARGQLGMCNRTGHSVAVINGREEMYGKQGRAPTRGDAIALV